MLQLIYICLGKMAETVIYGLESISEMLVEIYKS